MMDPNEALRRIRGLVGAVLDHSPREWQPRELAEQVQALDNWLSRGGFPPEDWREGPDAVGEEPPHVQQQGSYLAEPLGGPVPGVDGSVLPEHDHG